MHDDQINILPGLAEGGGIVGGAGCLSREPLGGFCSFFQGKPIWQSRVDSQKFTTLGLIPWILEGFCITMVTLSDFFKNSNREDTLCPGWPLPAKFWTDPSRNGAGGGGRCHKPYCFYSMITVKQYNISWYIYLPQIRNNSKPKSLVLCFKLNLLSFAHCLMIHCILIFFFFQKFCSIPS